MPPETRHTVADLSSIPLLRGLIREGTGNYMVMKCSRARVVTRGGSASRKTIRFYSPENFIGRCRRRTTTKTTNWWQRARVRARAPTREGRGQTTTQRTRTLFVRLSAVRGIRYRHNRRAEASSTGKSTAISAFPFTRITDSAWRAANHAFPFHQPLHLAPTLLLFLLSFALFLFLLLPLLSRSFVHGRRERSREEQGFAACFSIPREPRLAFVHAPSIWTGRASRQDFSSRTGNVLRAGDGRFVRGSPVSQ